MLDFNSRIFISCINFELPLFKRRFISVELRDFMISLGEKPYRSQQLYEAIYRRRVTGFEGMTELPKTLRRILDENAAVARIRIDNIFVSSDGTRRFLLKLSDGSEVESVFMPEEKRDTICISSQAGCPESAALRPGLRLSARGTASRRSICGETAT